MPPQSPESGREPTLPLPRTAPALNPPRWRGRKTAVAAVLALSLSSASAAAAVADYSAPQKAPTQQPEEDGGSAP